MSNLPIDTALLSRLDAAVCAYTLGRMRVAAEVRKEPETVRWLEWENVRALLAPSIPNPAFNTVLVSGPVALAQVEEALDAYLAGDTAPRVQVVPGAMSDELAALLSTRGFRQSVLQPVFVRRAREPVPDPGGSIRVTRVETSAAVEAFRSLYVRGWQLEPWLVPALESFIPRWVELPGWKLYLALERGEPVGVATLFEHGDVRYLADAATPPELRGRGAQTALLAARLQAAQESGAEVVFGMADFGTSSHRNLERAGVPMRFARALWTLTGPQQGGRPGV